MIKILLLNEEKAFQQSYEAVLRSEAEIEDLVTFRTDPDFAD
jgi:hypothetical protein